MNDILAKLSALCSNSVAVVSVERETLQEALNALAQAEDDQCLKTRDAAAIKRARRGKREGEMSENTAIRVLTEKIETLENEISRLNKLAEDRLFLLDQKIKAHDEIYEKLYEKPRLEEPI